jgi:hypothetical protein
VPNFEPDQNQNPSYPMEKALEAVATPANDTPAQGPETAPESAEKKNKGGKAHQGEQAHAVVDQGR